MIANDRDEQPNNSTQKAGVDETRRAALRRLGRFAAVTPPTVTLLLSATAKSNKAEAASLLPSSRHLKEPVSVAALRRVA